MNNMWDPDAILNALEEYAGEEVQVSGKRKNDEPAGNGGAKRRKGDSQESRGASCNYNVESGEDVEVMERRTNEDPAKKRKVCSTYISMLY